MQVSFQVTINKFHTETYLNLLFVFKNMQTTITWLTSLCTLLGGPRPCLLLPLACPSFWFLLWGDLVCDQGHETLQSPCLFNELNSIFLNTWINYSLTSVPSTHISKNRRYLKSFGSSYNLISEYFTSISQISGYLEVFSWSHGVQDTKF